jgi:hypothetical protein
MLMVKLKGLKVVLGKWPTCPIVQERESQREKMHEKLGEKRRNE